MWHCPQLSVSTYPCPPIPVGPDPWSPGPQCGEAIGVWRFPRDPGPEVLTRPKKSFLPTMSQSHTSTLSTASPGSPSASSNSSTSSQCGKRVFLITCRGRGHHSGCGGRRGGDNNEVPAPLRPSTPTHGCLQRVPAARHPGEGVRGARGVPGGQVPVGRWGSAGAQRAGDPSVPAWSLPPPCPPFPPARLGALVGVPEGCW